MPQEYQNEKSTKLNGQNKPRTWGNVQKIMELEGDGQNKAYYMNKPSPITLLFTNLGRH